MNLNGSRHQVWLYAICLYQPKWRIFRSIVKLIRIYMKSSIKLQSSLLAFTFLAFASFAHAQLTVTLGSGTSKFQASPSGPSPYNTDAANRIMQFVYTASEINAAGGSAGEIQSIAWKVADTIKKDMPDYGVWMKSTKATDVSSHDNSNLKLVKNRHDYKPGSPGWQTMKLDSTFYYDGKSSVLIQVCFGAINGTVASGTVFIYNNTPNQRRGEVGKGSICGSTSTSPFYWKPFIQFDIKPDCAPPPNLSIDNVTSNGADITWSPAHAGAEGYEYILRSTSGDPSGSGTYTTDTFLNVTGLCPSKLNYFFIRSVCSKGDTSEWSRVNIFQTKTGGGVSTNAPICEGEDMYLSVENANDYSWSGPNGFKSTKQRVDFTNTQRSSSGTYVVTITDTNSCVVTYSSFARVDSLPVAVITHNSPLCAKETYSVSTTGGETYSFTGPMSFTSDTSDFIIENVGSVHAGSYLMVLTNSFNCIGYDTIELEVNPLPIFTTSSNSPICVNDSLELSATGSYNFLWWGPQGFQSTDQNTGKANTSTANAGTYYIEAKSNKSCTTLDTIDVIINTLPDVSINGSTAVCEGASMVLRASGALTYQWTKDDEASTDSATYFVMNMGASDAATYRVMGTDKNGCTKWDERVVTKLDLPTANISVTDTVCEGLGLTMTAQTNGQNYSWSGPAGLKSGDLVTSIMAETKHSGIFKFTTYSSDGCMLELEKRAVVLPKPSISLIKQGNNLLASDGYNNYTWSLNGKEIKQGPSRIFTADTIGTYTVTVEGSNGCMATSNPIGLASLGIEDLTNDLNLFPNPMKDVIHVQSNSRIESIQVLDVMGRIVLSKSLKENSISLDVHQLPAGQYLIRVQMQDGVINRMALKY